MTPFDVQFAGLLPTGGGEWVLIFLIVLLLFGGAKLPSLAKGLGQSIKEFKKASSDVSNEIHNAMNEEPPPPSLPPAKPQAASETAAPAATVPKS